MPELTAQDTALFALLAQVPIDSIWTELDTAGYPDTYMEGLRPVHSDSNRRMIGRAVTLRYLPMRKDIEERRVASGAPTINLQAAEQALPGDIMVVDAGGEPGAGYIGDIIATRFVVRGGVGLVVDGAIRDLPALRDMDLALFVRHVHPAASWRRIVGMEINVPVRCGGVAVMPGDILVGDGMGVIVVPPHIAETIAAKALAREHKETFQREKLLGGASIFGVYPANEQTTREYEAWKQKKQG